ncbi:hypothetical protein SALBM135S_05408 [Streptomyces alboniger]
MRSMEEIAREEAALPSAPGEAERPSLALANTAVALPGGHTADHLGTPAQAEQWLAERDLVQVTKRPSGVGPPRKFYALNDAGREELAKFWAKWQYVSSRINRLKEGGR